MPTQQSLPFDVTGRKNKRNKNSVSANKKIIPAKKSLRQQIFEYIGWSKDGLTYEEICDQLGLRPQTVSGRISELKIEGKIKEVAQRQLSSGVAAAVYKAVWK
jgi:DNA-binding CsgD family transcriptional regulator